MHKIRGLFLFAAITGMCGRGVAASCTFGPTVTYPQSNTRSFNLPLAVNAISVRPDLAPGTIIYRQSINISSNAQQARVTCDSSGHFRLGYEYDFLPKTETSSDSKIYQTGVSGIGIQFIHNDGTHFPYIYATTSCTNTSSCFFSSIWPASSSFVLIKTSENVIGGTISGSDLPVARYSLGLTGSMVPIYDIKISGNLTVNTPTCNISLVSKSAVVSMGSHKVSDFSGQGSGTAWKDASIILHNCGQFYGNSSTSIAIFDGTQNIDAIGLTSNVASITLLPGDGINDATNGIMKIADNTATATGVGIQLSRSASTSDKIDLNAAYKLILPKDGSSNITIPLYARYIQTDSLLTAGKANGNLIYTISYQ